MAQTQLPGSQIKDADLKNVDIASDAAIDRSKLSLISALTGKTTPVDADVFEGADSAASNVSKKFTWANIKAALKTYFDTLYGSMNNPMTASGDIIHGGTSGAPARLAKGTDAQVLTLAGGLPSWASAGGGVKYVALTSGDFTTVNSAWTDVTGLSFSLTSGKKYYLKMFFKMQGTSGSNMNLQTVYSAAYTMIASTVFYSGVSSPYTPVFNQNYDPPPLSGAQIMYCIVEHIFTANANGTVKVQINGGDDDTISVKVGVNSWAILTEVL